MNILKKLQPGYNIYFLMPNCCLLHKVTKVVLREIHKILFTLGQECKNIDTQHISIKNPHNSLHILPHPICDLTQ